MFVTRINTGFLKSISSLGLVSQLLIYEEIITAIHYIRELAAVSKQVIVMRGTPNHDGAGQFNVLSEMFADCQNVHIVITPQVISFNDVDIAVLPGFDRGTYRAKFPGLSSDEENVVFIFERHAGLFRKILLGLLCLGEIMRIHGG